MTGMPVKPLNDRLVGSQHTSRGVTCDDLIFPYFAYFILAVSVSDLDMGKGIPW